MYELIYIVSPKVEDQDVASVNQQIEKIVTDHKGKLGEKHDLGKLKIATPIDGYRHGAYFIVQFEGDPKELKTIEKEMKLIEQIVRFMIIKYDEKTLAKMKSQKDKVKLITDPITKEEEEKPVGKDREKQEKSAPQDKTSIPTEETKQKVTQESEAPKMTTVDKEKKLELGITDDKASTESDERKPKVDEKELDKKLDEILDDDLI